MPVSAADILNARILVVDDKPDNVRLMEGMLRVAGYAHVESTTDPTAVAELYRANRYGLILLDLQMPSMDGFQVMEGLKAIEGEGYLPVLAITAQPAHKLHALEAGAKDFLGKPFDMAELRARVHNILEVRLLHLAAAKHRKVLEETIRELEASREVIRVKTLEEEARRAEELGRAQQTQESLLPRFLPQFENYDIRAYNNPTRYVGGDFYDFLPLKSGQWAGVLADVSGKGMPAALLSSMVLGALSSEFRAGTEPAEALNRINRLVCDKSLPDQFVTMFLFALGPDGNGQFVSAGHNPIFVFRAATGKIETLRSQHLILGMFEAATYACRPLRLEDGDLMVVYSDGLTDAEDSGRQMFGEDRLLKIIRGGAAAGGQALQNELLAAIEQFTGGTPQTDDITLVLVEKKGRGDDIWSKENGGALESVLQLSRANVIYAQGEKAFHAG
jgi:serine phosphatase RsbU (regulator of sigma subunit)